MFLLIVLLHETYKCVMNGIVLVSVVIAISFMRKGVRSRPSVLLRFFFFDLVIVISHDLSFRFSEISHLLPLNKTPPFAGFIFLVPSQHFGITDNLDHCCRIYNHADANCTNTSGFVS